MLKIQLVDDDKNTLSALGRLLRNKEWQLDFFYDVREALESLSIKDYDLIISDYRMPLLDGISYLEWARKKQPKAVRIVLTAYQEKDIILQAINKAEVFRFITKPWKNEDLITTINDAALSRLPFSEIADQSIAVHPLLLEVESAFLEKMEPGITQVDFDDEGAIVMRDD